MFVILNFGNQIIDFHHIGNLYVLQLNFFVFKDDLQRFYVILVHCEGLGEWLLIKFIESQSHKNKTKKK
jgi:hypothetical protein